MRAGLWAVVWMGCAEGAPTSKEGTTGTTSPPIDTDTPPTTVTFPTIPGPPLPCGAAPAPDLDPDPEVVEVAITADEADWDPGTGTAIHGVAFGGAVPGPTIEAELGQTLRIRFTNDTDAPTTLHWHGLRVPVDMDGVAQMMDPVAPGETFEYVFPLLDAGLYWYHPHMDVSMSIERGLYGMIVVHTPDEAPPTCDLAVALDDVLLDPAGQVEPEGNEMAQEMGRLGNLLLANGHSNPSVDVVAGSQALLRFVNAANARYFDLRLEDQVLTVVGTDGGFVAAPWETDRLLVGPGERYLVRVDIPDDVGRELVLYNGAVSLHDGGMGGMMDDDPLGDGDHPLLRFEVIDGDPGPSWSPPAVVVDPLVAGAVAHPWVIDDGPGMMGGLTIDGEVWPNVPPVVVPGGAPATFTIDNRSSMRHPMHIHGNRFQVLARNGIPVATPAWKDTFDLPAGDTLTLASPLDNPGEWLYHCHILEHADLGMMGILTVE